jgi:hypothetical protein
MEALYEAGSTSDLIRSLVDMLGFKPVEDADLGNSEDGEVGSFTRKENPLEGDDVDGFSEHDPAAILGCTVALWLLCVFSSHDRQSKLAVMEAGAIEVLTEKLAIFAPNARQVSSTPVSFAVSNIYYLICFSFSGENGEIKWCKKFSVSIWLDYW